MSSNLMSSALWLVVVSLLWGITNPLLKKTSSGIENIHKDNSLSQLFAQLIFLLSRWQYLAAFLANQSGSLLFLSDFSFYRFVSCRSNC